MVVVIEWAVRCIAIHAQLKTEVDLSYFHTDPYLGVHVSMYTGRGEKRRKKFRDLTLDLVLQISSPLHLQVLQLLVPQFPSLPQLQDFSSSVHLQVL